MYTFFLDLSLLFIQIFLLVCLEKFLKPYLLHYAQSQNLPKYIAATT